MTERQNFEALQKKMQIPKSKKGDVKYAFRNAEEIETHFKKVSDGWTLTFEDEIVELGGRLFYYANVLVQNKEKERYSSRGIAELGDVPILTTKTGKVIQQMQVPQWTGAVGSYARKYALQGVFAIGEEDVDGFQLISVEEFDNLTDLLQIKTDGNEEKIQQGIAYICKKMGITKLQDLTMNQYSDAKQIIDRLGNKEANK